MIAKNTISLDREKIIDFIKQNTNCNEFYSIQAELVEAILQIIPYLGRYEEEDKTFNFKLSVGICTTIENLEGRFHILHSYKYNDKDDPYTRESMIIRMIKKVAIFCEKDADIFLVQNEDIIQCGVYFTDLEKTGSTEEVLLNNKFVIIQNLHQNTQVLLGQSKQIMYICLDLNNNLNDKMNSSIFHKETSTTCRTWRGIFERVKKTVHGTICLIVDENWNPEEDNNFTNKIEVLNINLSRDDKITSDSYHNFENKINLFYSMLNFDGITIIDIEENIKAYNIFCKVDDEGLTPITGGARHRAYSYLKNLHSEKCKNYVGIYFQSQEGYIEFYSFFNKKVTNFFDPTIMNGNTDYSDYNKIKKIYNSQEKTSDDLNCLSKEEYSYYVELNELINDLQTAHHGIDNFYNEPKPAINLSQKLTKPEFLKIIEKYGSIRKNALNIVISCILGNSYGYSRAAQEPLLNIIKTISYSSWKKYFENMEFLDFDLLTVLIYDYGYSRWENIIIYAIKNNYHDDYMKIENINTPINDFKNLSRIVLNIEYA